MSQLLQFINDHAPRQILEMDVFHVIRLVIIVGGYIFLRQAYSKFMANRQLQQQLAQDNIDKDEERLRDLIDDPNAKSTGLDNGSWGWGKKTRAVNKRNQRILEEALENLQNGDVADDKDIEDLLEE